MKKIMFNNKYGLTQAVLENRKSQIRRAIKLKDGEYVKVVALDNGSFMSYVAKDGKPTAHVGALEMPNYVRPLTPKYFIGEEVAIAQSYFDCGYSTRPRYSNDDIQYGDGSAGFYNKMFVRADLMPHHIRITNVRVERLQDISDEDCLKEGIECKNERFVVQTYKGVVFYTTDVKLAYKYLIDKTCGRSTWDSNPYVFVYDFELVK